MVADNQFSVLGLVLIAELARVRRIIASDEKSHERAENLAEAKLDTGLTGHALGLVEDLGQPVSRTICDNELRNGEPVSAESVQILEKFTTPDGRLGAEHVFVREESEEPASSTQSSRIRVQENTKKRKIRSRSGNAIDRLFSGLER